MIDQYKNEDAVVLMSGGQDSTTCLYWGIKNFKRVHTVSFLYNQKHDQEIEIAQKISANLNVENKVVDLSFMKDLVISNLFKETPDVNQGHLLDESVPSSYVPYRNLIFLTMAAAWATTVGAKHLITGVCETDYSGYADCRDVFIKSTQSTLNLSTDFQTGLTIHTPLMWLSKGEEFKMAEELGCLDVILKETLSCYNGDETAHPWGKGCNDCPACKLRAGGYEDYLNKYKDKN